MDQRIVFETPSSFLFHLFCIFGNFIAAGLPAPVSPPVRKLLPVPVSPPAVLLPVSPVLPSVSVPVSPALLSASVPVLPALPLVSVPALPAFLSAQALQLEFPSVPQLPSVLALRSVSRLPSALVLQSVSSQSQPHFPAGSVPRVPRNHPLQNIFPNNKQ